MVLGSREAAIAFFASLIELLGGNAVEAEGETAETVKRKPGRPKAAQAADTSTTTSATPAAPAVVDPFATLAPAAPARVYTQQDMVRALKEVAARRPGDTGPEDGFNRVKKVIQKINPAYENVSLVQEKDYAAVIAETGVVV